MQDPKYEFRDGHVYNRQSGEMVPDDEPVFVFRARDIHAQDALEYYACQLSNDEHRAAVTQRVSDFAAFAWEHPERMKRPDTDLGAWEK